MSVFPLGGNATHEVVPKTMKRFRVAGLGEDVRNVVTRANVVERQGVVNHRMMISVGVCDSVSGNNGENDNPSTPDSQNDATDALQTGVYVCQLLALSVTLSPIADRANSRMGIHSH